MRIISREEWEPTVTDVEAYVSHYGSHSSQLGDLLYPRSHPLPLRLGSSIYTDRNNESLTTDSFQNNTTQNVVFPHTATSNNEFSGGPLFFA